ncbi:MAG: type II toxin-antitoxin system RelE/ParE family toxin [candidate division NC10 bacterium]|nr:type II toxin-antitoxin system RelE/ParE family toxin [candidate division NC10 bacterium]
MTPHQIRYTPTAAESIRHLHPSIKRALREAIRGLAADPLSGHPLAFELAGFRSLRVSRYRVIYRVQEADRVVEIHLVGARRDIYAVFRQFLERTAQA